MATNTGTRNTPFGPPATILQVIRHYHQREVPETLTMTHLTQIGVKDSVMRLVRHSLVFLNLIREDGTTTDNFKAIRYATDEERTKVFRDLVTEAYRDIFAVVNPEQATRGQLFNAFRPYSPASQHDRMITLFLALCQEAGYAIPQAPRQASIQNPRPRPATSPPAKQTPKTGGAPPNPQHRVTVDNALLFGVSESDIGNLSEADFNEVWAALGKVARARARAQEKAAATPPKAASDADEVTP
jgi:hypothetical protein